MSPGDLLTHRVSGYYTSSQSSVAENRFGKYFVILSINTIILKVANIVVSPSGISLYSILSGSLLTFPTFHS